MSQPLRIVEGMDVVEDLDATELDQVSIGKVRLVGSFGGQITIEWTLSTAVDDWWITAFTRSPAQRRGSIGGSGEPVVQPEGSIRWSVLHADLANAVAFVLQSVAFANSVMHERWGRSAPTRGRWARFDGTEDRAEGR